MTDDNTKTCTKCGVTYPATVEFWYRSRGKLRVDCKVCGKERVRKYRAANPEKVRESKRKERAANPEKARESSRKWAAANPEKVRERGRKYFIANPEKFKEQGRKYRADNPEKGREYSRKYRAANPEKARESSRKWAAANPEKVRERGRKYRADNPEKLRDRDRKRRTIEAKLPYDFPPWMVNRALDYWHGCCAICGRQLEDLFNTHIGALDHWIALRDPRPIEDNPGTVATNMIPLCHGIAGCNNKKFNKDPYEWVKQEHGTRKAKPIIAEVETFFDWVREEDA